jgi:hypothetical protein
VKGVAEANDVSQPDPWGEDVTQEAAAALARNAQKHLFALCRELTSLAEDADARLSDIADLLRCAVSAALGDYPGVAFFLLDAVSAAFDLGSGLAAKDLKQQQTQRARDNLYSPESEEINQKIAMLSIRGEGFMSDGEFAQLFKLSKNAVKKRGLRMFGKRSRQKRPSD